jgi:hypothetical protein
MPAALTPAPPQSLELYDLLHDPGEARNLATRRRAVTQKLQRRALLLYRDIVPPHFTVSQSTRQVEGRCTDRVFGHF